MWPYIDFESSVRVYVDIDTQLKFFKGQVLKKYAFFEICRMI